MTVQEIKNLSMEDVSKMSKAELEPIVKQASKIAKSRITKLQTYVKENNLPTPTVLREWNVTLKTESKMYKYGLVENKSKRRRKRSIGGELQNTRGNISYQQLDLDVHKDTSLNAMRYKFKMIKGILNAETSTIQGWKRVLNKFKSNLKGVTEYDEEGNRIYRRDNSTRDLTKNEFKRLWKIYNRINQSKTVLSSANMSSDELQRNIYLMRVQRKMTWKDIEDKLLRDDEEYEERQRKLLDNIGINDAFELGDNE